MRIYRIVVGDIMRRTLYARTTRYENFITRTSTFFFTTPVVITILTIIRCVYTLYANERTVDGASAVRKHFNRRFIRFIDVPFKQSTSNVCTRQCGRAERVLNDHFRKRKTLRRINVPHVTGEFKTILFVRGTPKNCSGR